MKAKEIKSRIKERHLEIVGDYLVSKSLVESCRPLMEELTSKFLADNVYFTDPMWSDCDKPRQMFDEPQRILKDSDIYLASNEDMLDYCERVGKLKIEKGYVPQVEGRDYFLELDSALIEAEHLVVIIGFEITGKEPMDIYNLDLRKKWVDNVLKLLVPMVDREDLKEKYSI